MKYWKHLTALTALIVLLAACGSTTNEEAEPVPTEETAGEESTSPEEQQTEETDEEATEEATEETSEETTAIGERVESDNQPFSLELMDGYSLTAEEPNRDVIYFDANDAVFMRVETFSKDEADRGQTIETLQQTIQASDAEGSLMEIATPAKLPNVDMPIGYEMMIESGKVTGYVFETELHLVRATIYDSAEDMKTGDYLQMLSTFQTHE